MTLEPNGIASSSAFHGPPFPKDADTECTRVSRKADVAFFSAYRPLPSTDINTLPGSNVDVPDTTYALKPSPFSAVLEFHSSCTSADSVFDSFNFEVPSASPLSQNAWTSPKIYLTSPPA